MYKNSNGISKLLSSRVKLLTGLGIISVLGLSFVAYFFFQLNYEQQIRSTIFEQQKQQHAAYAKSVSNNIRSDLDSLQVRLRVIAQSAPFQSGDFTSPRADSVIQQMKEEIRTTVPIDSIGVIDKNDKVAYNSEEKYQTAIGQDRSYREWVVETRNTLSPVFSDGYYGQLSGTMDIAITYPILDQHSGEYLGLVVATLNVQDYLSHYGNIADLGKPYLGFLDEHHFTLASPFADSIGVNFYDPALKYDQSPLALEHFNRVFSGQSSLALFSYRTGERLNAAEPIVLGGKPEYFVFYVTPTAAIYSHIDSVISSERTGFYILQGAIAGAIAIALFFLLRWSGTIERAVKERTFELQDANEQLKTHDKLQREFINVAAHELRTPIQPILGSADMMNQEFAQGKDKIEVTKAEVEMIIRNAQRLERLSSDILTVSRIEAGAMPIHFENFDIAEKIKSVVEDTRVTIPMNGKKIDILYQSPSIMIDADKPKIYEVLANLLGNAVKFTEEGSITVTAEKSSDGNEVIVKVKDTGTGINPEITPRLFTRFAAKSEKGTGLGLYICKSILEAHGGRIWGENNADGKGATFSFTLPIARPRTDNNTALPLEAKNGTG